MHLISDNLTAALAHQPAASLQASKKDVPRTVESTAQAGHSRMPVDERASGRHPVVMLVRSSADTFTNMLDAEPVQRSATPAEQIASRPDIGRMVDKYA